MKKILIGFILLACLVIFPRWNRDGAMAIQTEEGVDPSAMVKIFRSSYQFSGYVYVVHSDKGTILIDPGYYDSEIGKHLREIGDVDAILLSHGHWDHISGLYALKADFPEAKVCIFKEDREFLTDSHLNCSETKGYRLILRSEVTPIPEGELEIGAYRIQVIHTPGHTRCSVMYYFTDENLLFSGDTILEEVTGPTFRPTGSDQDMRDSVMRFKYAELPTESNHWIRVNGEKTLWTSDMRLLYRCEKRNGTWKNSNMTSVFEMDKLSPVIPGTDLHVNPEDLKGLRSSYLWLSYVRIRAGGSVSNDLLGIDRSDEVQKIYEKNEAWIAEETER